MPSAPLVALRGVGKVFPTGTQALAGLDLEIRQGEFVALLGPSGCGKSTALRIVAGLSEPTDGVVEWLSPADETRSGNRLGFVFQEPTLMPWASVFTNVLLPLDLQHKSAANSAERVAAALDRVGLTAFRHAYPRELSGGMRMRVSIARALVTEPELLLMDEPFAALDEQTRLLLGDKVLQIQQQLKQTTLLITHNITEAVQLADRILVMSYRPGRVKRIVDVKLPRPRTSEIVSSEAFGRYVAQIWADLREEASRGMIDDETRTLHAQEPRS